MPAMDKSLRLLDFNIYDEVDETDTSSGSESGQYEIRRDLKRFKIQIYGINESGETFCLLVKDYKPFFYIKVDDSWGLEKKGEFLNHIKSSCGP